MLKPQDYSKMDNSVEIGWTNVPYNSKILGFSVPLIVPVGSLFSGALELKGRYNLGNATVGKIRIGDLKLEAFKFQNQPSGVTLWSGVFLPRPFPLPSGFNSISLDLDIDTAISQNQAYYLSEDESTTYCYAEVMK